jgi:hypothetical protein
MLSRFGALFEGINNYAYEPVTAADDDECMICKEPYLKDDSSGADGCHAIRITECGHIIGLECFSVWIQRQPETCTYWNHHLKDLSMKLSSPEYVCGRICNSRWFMYIETSIHFFEYRNRDRWPYKHQRLLNALEALHANCLTYTHAYHIMISYVFNPLVSRPNWSLLYPIFIFGALINILLISYVGHINEGSPFYVFNIVSYKIWELLTETPADPENMILFVSCVLSVAMVVVVCTVNHILFFASVAQVLVMSLRKSKRNEQVPRRNNHVLCHEFIFASVGGSILAIRCASLARDGTQPMTPSTLRCSCICLLGSN